MGITDKFYNKKVLLWGYGAEGKASEHFLKKYCQPELVEVYEGKKEALPIEDYDYVIKSPGVPYIYTDEPKMTSMTELFLEEFRDQTIGITGTKGKSTTTSMLYKVLSENLDRKVCLLGNIGIPSIDAYEEMKNGAIAVYEMSCHQLANNAVSPHIAVFLNLYEDHLDYYHTKEAYFEAKSHIAYYQTDSDYLYCGSNVPHIDTDASVIVVPDIDSAKYELNIPGLHNQWNADVVLNIACERFGVAKEAALKSLNGFNGLPHRLEKFASIDGVDWYDDSISTIPEATVNAIKSVYNTNCVIVGGMDRGIDYRGLLDEVRKRQDIRFVLCYATGERLLNDLSGCDNVIYVPDLLEAVKWAKNNVKEGAVILSPAAASYGYFKNFVERGEKFKELVLQ